MKKPSPDRKLPKGASLICPKEQIILAIGFTFLSLPTALSQDTGFGKQSSSQNSAPICLPWQLPYCGTICAILYSSAESYLQTQDLSFCCWWRKEEQLDPPGEIKLSRLLSCRMASHLLPPFAGFPCGVWERGRRGNLALTEHILCPIAFHGAGEHHVAFYHSFLADEITEAQRSEIHLLRPPRKEKRVGLKSRTTQCQIKMTPLWPILDSWPTTEGGAQLFSQVVSL